MIGRRALVVALVALGAVFVVAPVSAAPTSTLFTGIWVSTDADGSSQMLAVSGGRSPSVVYQDFYASGCDTFGGPSTHWVAAGKGTVDGTTLWVEFHKSGCGWFGKGGYVDFYTYDAGTNTLVDQFEITWYRA